MDTAHFESIVLGVGNLLLSDEGVGVRVIQRLVENYHIPDEVQLLDGGTLGLDLLYYLENIENLLLIDAVEAGKEPASLIRLEGEEVPSFLSIKISPHQIGIPDMLSAAKLKGIFPKQVVLWGIQPALLDIGLDLSPEVASQVDILVSNVVLELQKWGHTLRLRNDPN